MEIRWNEYQKVEEFKGFNVYQHQDAESPKYAFKATKGLAKGWEGIANNLTDAKILINDYYHQTVGLGCASGYRRVSTPPPEAIYRNVNIGKYLFREKAIDLPKLKAIVRPVARTKSTEKLYRSFWVSDQPNVLLEGNTIKEMKKQIDATIEEYPAKYRKLFPK